MTIDEINTRLSAIAAEIETADGARLAELETEVESLTEERTRLENEAQTRQALRARVASGAVGVPSAIVPPAPTDTETIEQRELRSFANYIRGTVSQMRAGEQDFTMSNNTAIVPETIAQRIITAVEDMCPILAGAEVYHVKGKLQIPTYGAKTEGSSDHDISVGYSDEFSELTADAGAFSSIELSGYLVGVLTLVGRSLINNTDVDLVAFVVNKMAEKISFFVENELLNGTGSANNHCTGALSTNNVINAGSTSTISADNLIEVQAKIKQMYQNNACWTMNPATWTAIKKLKDATGKYLVSDDFSGGFPYRLLGKPVYLSDNMPTIASAAKAILYGDYSGLGVNIREDVSIEVLREKYATQHAIGIVGWLELDSKVVNSQKLATLVMSTN